jgi:rhodanese-related sulfurtransferase
MKTNTLNNAALAFTVIMVIVVIVSKLYSEDYDVTSENAIEMAAGEEGMSLQELYATLQSGEKEQYLFVDLRKPDVFEYDHIKGAVNIPYSELLAEKHRSAFDNDKTVVFYGKDEVNSSNAWFLLRQLNYDNVTYLHGGFALANKHIIKNYHPSYGHFKAGKPQYDFAKYFKKQEKPEKQEVEVKTTIEVSGGC